MQVVKGDGSLESLEKLKAWQGFASGDILIVPHSIDSYEAEEIRGFAESIHSRMSASPSMVRAEPTILPRIQLRIEV